MALKIAFFSDPSQEISIFTGKNTEKNQVYHDKNMAVY